MVICAFYLLLLYFASYRNYIVLILSFIPTKYRYFGFSLLGIYFHTFNMRNNIIYVTYIKIIV